MEINGNKETPIVNKEASHKTLAGIEELTDEGFIKLCNDLSNKKELLDKILSILQYNCFDMAPAELLSPYRRIINDVEYSYGLDIKYMYEAMEVCNAVIEINKYNKFNNLKENFIEQKLKLKVPVHRKILAIEKQISDIQSCVNEKEQYFLHGYESISSIEKIDFFIDVHNPSFLCSEFPNAEYAERLNVANINITIWGAANYLFEEKLNEWRWLLMENKPIPELNNYETELPYGIVDSNEDLPADIEDTAERESKLSNGIDVTRQWYVSPELSAENIFKKIHEKEINTQTEILKDILDAIDKRKEQDLTTTKALTQLAENTTPKSFKPKKVFEKKQIVNHNHSTLKDVWRKGIDHFNTVIDLLNSHSDYFGYSPVSIDISTGKLFYNCKTKTALKVFYRVCLECNFIITPIKDTEIVNILNNTFQDLNIPYSSKSEWGRKSLAALKINDIEEIKYILKSVLPPTA